MQGGSGRDTNTANVQKMFAQPRKCAVGACDENARDKSKYCVDHVKIINAMKKEFKDSGKDVSKLEKTLSKPDECRKVIDAWVKQQEKKVKPDKSRGNEHQG